tara:strand:+ start:792 stop:1997 length:1206 start_codon:yes stop_codon:yes gene_type:complete
MACPASGPIKISDLVAEFGGTAPHAMTEYYRNGGEVPGNNTNVPESGQISLTQFYSAVNEIQQVYSSNATNLNLASVFGSNWSTAVPKRVVINSGVTIGGTNTHAINVPSGMGGTLIIDNNGSIEGYGGTGGTSGAGGTGGNGVHCVQTSGVTINNNGAIKAGGGGGGKGGTGGVGGNGGSGGTGGQGRYGYISEYQSSYWYGSILPMCRQSQCGHPNHHCVYGLGSVSGFYGYQGYGYRAGCMRYSYTSGGSGGAGGTSGGAGGAGGNGGNGQGYNQSNSAGSSGSAGSGGGGGSAGSNGGTNAGAGGVGGNAGTGGTGGTGGAGGTFGNAGGNGLSGSTGGTGLTGNSGGNGNYTNGSAGSSGTAGSAGSSGSSGGAAGYYVYNRSSITFNNSGTTAGN